ncbi:uncharacterized protein [Dysidea avara]|uniref:uncharacterized protein n=1 Tax=Dysidea avara TaxID=196820 RepID=UPI0033266724
MASSSPSRTTPSKDKTEAATTSIQPPPRPPRPTKLQQSEETEEDLVITSESYTLEEFARHFQLPQMVRVNSGYYGSTEQLSISEGEELILYFVKSTKVVKATTRYRSETYYLPLNSLLQFSPYYEPKTAAATSGGKGNSTAGVSHHFKTVGDLIQRKDGLPKVVKVCSSIPGSSKETSVSEGEIIFPKKVSGKGNNVELKCKNKNGDVLRLNQSCVGNFSTEPSDVRMCLHDYVEYINQFPVPSLIFGGQEQSKNLSKHADTVLVLEAFQPFRSYICSTDIFGKADYPMIELPMIVPIQIQRMERSSLYMQPIYYKVQHAYEHFDPSMVRRSMYPAQSLEAQRYYEQVTNDDGLSYYELERPENIYEQIPGEAMEMVPTTIKPPPPPARSQSFPSDIKEPTQASMAPNFSTYQTTASSPEENIGYLKTMDVETVLQLLADMNLGEYKDSFQREQVDGELLVVLTKDELEDLGVTKKIHQLRLLKVIDGSSSAKKYEGGTYGILSKPTNLVHK